MARRLHPTLADYLVIAVGPVLIMALVGSLVFFLLEVFYQGDYQARLQYILALFVMAAVLIGRISIESGTDRAAMFALPLAIVTGLAIHRFVANASVFNWLLLGLIWWSAHRLTWDCTFLDESKDVSDEGLLQTIGQGRDRMRTGDVTPADQERREAGNGDDAGGVEEEPEGVTSREDRKKKAQWWEFWIDRRARPNAPGVWIVYFSLAALPVFGIGQGLISAEDVASRRRVFWLLCIYVASGLGLLMNTSFLGLRRYLRQRRLQMPSAMAGLWIAVGSVLIIGLLVLALFLPRRNAGDPLAQFFSRLESPEREPSRYALGNEGVRRDDAQRGGTHRQEAKEGDRGRGEAKDEKQGQGRQGEKESSQGEQGKKSGKSQTQGSKGQGKSGEEDSSPRQQGRKSDQAKPQDAKGQEKPGDQGSTKRQPGEKSDQAESQDRRSQEQEHSPESTPEHQVSLPDVSWSHLLQWLGPALRWLLYAVVFLVAGYWIWRARLQVMAAIHELLAAWREFWERLFGHGVRESDSPAVDEAPSEPPRPLSMFADPFATGEASRMSPAELVRYTFAALEAWARENHCAREPEETPHEFVRKVGELVTPLSREAWILADLYCRVAYAPERLSAVTARPIEQLWQHLLGASRPSHAS